MRKRCNRVPYRKESPLMAFKVAVAKSHTGQVDDIDRSIVQLPMLSNLNALECGQLDSTGFTRMCELNAMAYAILEELFLGKETPLVESEAVAAVMRHGIVAAAEAYQAIAERYKKISRFVATGDELRVIRASASHLDELLNISSKGTLMAALIKAKHQVETAGGTSTQREIAT